MLLENRYYTITESRMDGATGRFRIRLLPDCDIYRGHFPGNPVCPGVCGIEMVKELAMRMTGRELFIRAIKRCRLTAVASPEICPEQEVTIELKADKDCCVVSARLTDTEKTYMEYKGEMAYVAR